MRCSRCCSKMSVSEASPAAGIALEPGVPMIDIRKLWTVFATPEKRFVVHQDLDMSVQRGEVLSLVGGSGTGKTVLLRQILGLERPARGEVRVLGQKPGQHGAGGAAKVG